MSGSVLMCPPPDDQPWPTLGLYVADWIEEHLCHGPGDLLGERVTLNREQRAWLAKMYEVEPDTGRRRFQRCALSLRKGSSKTEFAAWVAIAELHPDAPVRCDGFQGGRPLVRGVADPYIPMIAYSEEQTEELAYGALRRILQECAIGADFDIGLERVVRLGGDGKAEAVATSPNARDGARTTWCHADETHRLILDGQRRAWTVMLNNLAKRPLADPWALETTTAPEPGAGSVAEGTMDYARAVLAGKTRNAKLFFYHRQASDGHDLSVYDQRRAAVLEASGPHIAAWSDIDRICAAYDEPDADRAYWERIWTNRLVQSSGRAFDIEQWRGLVAERLIPIGSAVCIGLSGPRDSGTALVATHLETGHQWPLGIWERPLTQRTWEVPATEVDGRVRDAFAVYHVCRMYCDPAQWEGLIAEWARDFGEKRVFDFRIQHKRKAMAFAVRAYVAAIAAGEVSHDGDERMDQHIANARQSPTGFVEDDKPLWILRRERMDSPDRIDAANAAVLSWEARTDAVTAGEGVEPEAFVYVG